MPFDKAEIHVVRSQEDDHCDQLQVNHACHKPAEKQMSRYPEWKNQKYNGYEKQDRNGGQIKT